MATNILQANTGQTTPLKMDCFRQARLHPLAGGRYTVIFDGRLLVERSRDPECDAARALLARSITGKLSMLDGKTGRPRTVVDIERAAKVRVSEESRDGLRF